MPVLVDELSSTRHRNNYNTVQMAVRDMRWCAFQMHASTHTAHVKHFLLHSMWKYTLCQLLQNHCTNYQTCQAAQKRSLQKFSWLKNHHLLRHHHCLMAHDIQALNLVPHGVALKFFAKSIPEPIVSCCTGFLQFVFTFSGHLRGSMAEIEQQAAVVTQNAFMVEQVINKQFTFNSSHEK